MIILKPYYSCMLTYYQFHIVCSWSRRGGAVVWNLATLTSPQNLVRNQFNAFEIGKCTLLMCNQIHLFDLVHYAYTMLTVFSMLYLTGTHIYQYCPSLHCPSFWSVSSLRQVSTSFQLLGDSQYHWLQNTTISPPVPRPEVLGGGVHCLSPEERYILSPVNC